MPDARTDTHACIGLLKVIAGALLSAQNEDPDDADRADAYVDAHVILDALMAHGERWQVIGRMFYDDTDEGMPVLVVPLGVEAGT